MNTNEEKHENINALKLCFVCINIQDIITLQSQERESFFNDITMCYLHNKNMMNTNSHYLIFMYVYKEEEKKT